jgi:ubiquitin-conjugating enzyme E2 A
MIDIMSLLTSLRSLLADPNPDSPANQEAARLFLNSPLHYHAKVKEVVELSWKTHLPLF